MKPLDLKPDEYRVRDPKSGRWFRRPSKPVLFALSVALLGCVGIAWWRRDEITDIGTALLVCTMMGVSVGVMLAEVFRDYY